MKVYLGGNFWSAHFERAFIPQVDAYCTAMAERILPTFVAIDAEADNIAQSEYERLISVPALEHSNDISYAAESAWEAGLAYYETLASVQQTILNLAVAG